MRRSRSNRRNHLRGFVGCEALETRNLMASDLLLPEPAARGFAPEATLWYSPWASPAFTIDAGYTAEQWAASYSQLHRNFPSLNANIGSEILKFTSETEAQDFLIKQLSAEWQNVFGVSVNRDSFHAPYVTPIFAVRASDELAMYSSSTLQPTGAQFDGLPAAVQNNGLSNVQTVGVDEPDSFKLSSDGFAYVYVTKSGGTEISIFDVRDPLQMTKVGSIDLEGTLGQLHLVGNQLIVVRPFAPLQTIANFSSTDVPLITTPDSWSTRIDVYDVTDKSLPKLQSSTSVSGTNYRSRFTENGLVLYGTDWIGTEWIKNLQPQFIALDPSAKYVELPETAIGRFETADEYVARIRPLVLDWMLPRITTTDANGALVESPSVADWTDLNFYKDVTSDSMSRPSQKVIATSFELIDAGLKPIDTEVLVGAGMILDYTDHDSIYLTEWAWPDSSFMPGQLQTRISAFSFDASGVDFVGAAFVPGQISSSRMMSDYEGDLRIFTESREWAREAANVASTDLHILRPQNGKLEVIGQLLDVADGQAIYSAYFDEAQAFITTWVAELPFRFIPVDPLHAFDLSDPANPIELSELVIPGVSLYLHRVDESHLVGIGYVEKLGQWHQQVSLYDISDLEQLKTIATWTSDNAVAPNFSVGSQNPLAIHFDPESGLLSVPFREFNGVWSPLDDASMTVFKVSPASADPLQFLADISKLDGNFSTASRSAVLGETLYVVSESWLLSYSTESFEKYLDRVLITTPAPWIGEFFAPGETRSVTLIRSGDIADGRVISIGESSIGATVTLHDDGTVTYTAPAIEASGGEILKFRVESPDGEIYEGSLWIQIPIAVNEFSIESVGVFVAVVDDQGVPVESMTKGAEYWIEVQATDLREAPQGIFATYVDVLFNAEHLSVIGTAEGIGDFKHEVKAVVESSLIRELGAFTASTTPSGVATSRIARIRVRAEIDGATTLSGAASTSPVRETLVFGDNLQIAPENVIVTTSPNGSSPVSPAKVMTTKLIGDINGDGEQSPMDVLLVVEYLNRQSARMREGEMVLLTSDDTHTMDISGDGVISPIDVLLIVKELVATNTRLVASGEFVAVQAVRDQAFGSWNDVCASADPDFITQLAADMSDLDEITAKRVGRSSLRSGTR